MRLRGTQIDIKNEQDFDFGAANGVLGYGQCLVAFFKHINRWSSRYFST